MKKAYTFLVATFLMSALSITKTWGQYPGSGQVPLDPLVTPIPQFVDPLPHFAGLRVNAKAGGNLIIEAVKTRQVALSTGTVLPGGAVVGTPGAGLGNYFAYRISKDGGNTWAGPLWPAFTIEARKGNKLDIELRNKLNGLTYQDVNIAADQTVMMSGVPTVNEMTDPYTGPIPIAMHLHGGEVQSASDGGPFAWFTPDYALKGKGWDNGVGPILHYPNSQEAATLWFHEHSQLGLTRINVYAGMAGFYFLRGWDEELARLPGWSKDNLVKENTPAGKVADALHPDAYLPEIEIVIQDRMFDQNGQLYYDVEPNNPELHPFWNPEFFGNVITVNGKTWPYLSVAPRKYRFHFLDGSNARFYNMWLHNLATGANGPALIQVGTDGGMLDSPVVLDPTLARTLLMAPGERADIIIDFSKFKGQTLTLMNDANAPYPMGDEVERGFTDRIMQFVVNGDMVNKIYPKKVGPDLSAVPNRLRLSPIVKFTDFAGNLNAKPDVIRQLTLNEVMNDDEPVMVLVNNSRYEPVENMPDMPEMSSMFGDVTEKPVEGTTEKWQIVNLTMDAHPMHLHLVQFQLVSRQNFDVMRYKMDYMDSFTGVNGGMAGMYMGAEGPPFKYDVKNSDGAIGGNLPVTPYLIGAPIPADPNEKGWKDVLKCYPGQITTYMVRFAPQELPVWWPKALSRFSFDPGIGPGYVWHCHIVEHEDNDMMRPMDVQSNPSRKYFKAADIASTAITSGEGFSLGQNSPNPFNNETEIIFNVPEDCHVQLILYNLQGTKIQTLIDADAPAGNHKVMVSADKLSSGTYLYELKAGSFVETRKMIIN